jgi:hypothetical protein
MIYTEDIDILMIAEYPLYTSEDELLANFLTILKIYT